MSSKRVEEEYKELVASNSWPQIYQRIGRKCHVYPYTCIEAKKPQNKPLNRYRDVNPYDHSRVILKRCDKDYINANLVKMERANRQYILTQGPLVYTVSHFWSMVWEQNTRAIIMLNKIIEKNELKCHWYWPHLGGEQNKMVLKDVNLIIEQTEEVDHLYYVTRFLRVTDMATEETRTIAHFHYTTWPDFEVPSSPVAFLEFLNRVRASGALDADVGPAIVHCSAGIGRSGTFCLVDTVLLLIEKEGQANVDIQDILLEMRKYRMGLIQTSEQLRFSYQAIIEGIKRLDPDYTPELAESIYSSVAEEEEAPPPPPPRGESLSRPPARPLPAIPTSASLGNLNVRAAAESSGSDEETPTPPPRDTSSPASTVSSADEEEEKVLIARHRYRRMDQEQRQRSRARAPHRRAEAQARRERRASDLRNLIMRSTPNSGASLQRQKYEIDSSSGEDSGLPEVRRRKQRELSERVATMRKRSRDADRWHSFKRSLYTPIAISVGFLLAGILIYSYVKH